MKRHFLVSYAHSTGFGDAVFTTEGAYINRIVMVTQIEENGPKVIGILNIIELSESDFKDFISK